ncbi:MAG: DNA primase [Arenicellales bacterium]
MARIPEQFIDELIGRIDIAELIDHRVPLQRAGNEFRACCPFHNEKTPSFYVSPTKQFYHCFGCGAHGTSVSFLMEYENMDFLDAIESLASQAGMVVPKEAIQDDGARQKQAALIGIVERANKWYQTQLKNHPEAKQAVDYLKNRELEGKTAAEFGMGFAPDGWDNLIKVIGDSPQNIELLVEAGLVIVKEPDAGNQQQTRRHYDRFRARVMFPIEDHRGRLVGFGGRVIGKGEPKYLNSPETPLFHKGSELYGFYRARREIGKLDESIVVEGYMDVVGLAQNGVNNAVATLGTATTPMHLQRLFRAASKVVFCFDGDRAGRKAAWRALEIALPSMEDGRQIRFLLMPDGEDPDSLIRQEGKAGFEKRLSESLSLNTFMFDSLSSDLDLSQMDQRAKLATLARPLLQKLPQGNFKTMMYAHLSEVVGVAQAEAHEAPANQAASQLNTESQPPIEAYEGFQPDAESAVPEQGAPQPMSPLIERAISLLVQKPCLVEIANEFELNAKGLAGMGLLDQLVGMINVRSDINTAQLLERLRDHARAAQLSEFAAKDLLLEEAHYEADIRATLKRIVSRSQDQAVDDLLNLSKQRKLDTAEQAQLTTLLKQKSSHAA